MIPFPLHFCSGLDPFPASLESKCVTELFEFRLLPCPKRGYINVLVASFQTLEEGSALSTRRKRIFSCSKTIHAQGCDRVITN
jgi:hypothetical protein